MSAHSIHSSFKSRKGSVLFAALFIMVAMALMAVSVFDWSLSTYRSTVRKERLNQARLAAGNEVEYLFYQWANQVDTPSASSLENRLASTQLNGVNVVVNWDSVSTTAVSPVLTMTNAAGEALDVTVGRGLKTLDDTSGVGTVRIGGLRKTASVGYYTARAQAQLNDPTFGTITVRIGRRMAFQKVSPFNFAVFYSGDLELNPSGNMVVGGDVQCNNSIYIGSSKAGGGTVNITGDVYFYTKFNGATDALSGTQTHQFKPDNWNAPIFDRDLGNDTNLSQEDARADQVKKMAEKESFIANVDPVSIYAAYPDAYDSPNDVMRAIIAPPPVNGGGTLIPENPVVAANRLYNKASLRIEVKDVSGTPTAVFYDASGTDVTGKFSGVVTSVRNAVRDRREGVDVAMTTINVGQLKAVIESDETLKNKYNGVVYIHDTAQETDPTNRYGIRLSNASDIPNFNKSGFTVASNNGVYLQGDFNTSFADPGSDDAPRSAVLADSITVLSQGWKDENADNPLADDTGTFTAAQIRKAATDIKINAALVSGNTPSIDDTKYGNSGGVQNLVRLLEDWTGRTTTINGSLGQMFESKYFKAQFKPNGYTDDVYQNPSVRYLSFNRLLAAKPPAGAPASVTRFYRGDLFTW
ncbi:MAG: hypothetical protein SFV32_14555 [Opitutaceae bacterium]|nr:hypothetical protein [Opitutaceae bacterium]